MLDSALAKAIVEDVIVALRPDLEAVLTVAGARLWCL
jgi:hypothetical protein